MVLCCFGEKRASVSHLKEVDSQAEKRRTSSKREVVKAELKEDVVEPNLPNFLMGASNADLLSEAAPAASEAPDPRSRSVQRVEKWLTQGQEHSHEFPSLAVDPKDIRNLDDCYLSDDPNMPLPPSERDRWPQATKT